MPLKKVVVTWARPTLVTMSGEAEKDQEGLDPCPCVDAWSG